MGWLAKPGQELSEMMTAEEERMVIRCTGVLAALFVALSASVLPAQQRMLEREKEFLEGKPAVGDAVPLVTVFQADGTEFSTTELRGSYSVLTFGCLTCPPSMWNIPGIEAVHRDYSPRGVKFYYIYKSLAHPEINGGIVQPFTQDERLAQARQAEQQFGTQIPWLVDAMDNRLKHALGDRPNAQFVIDPDGKIVRKWAWANPAEVRKELERAVGPVEHVTREEDLYLNIQRPLAAAAPQGLVQPLPREGMLPLVVQPHLEENELPFLAKLRVEADPGVLRSGAGRVYLGFHLDPLHRAHWNNLTKPLQFKITAPESVQLSPHLGAAEPVAAASDADPREFFIDVSAWPAEEPLELTVSYFACIGEETCHAVRQTYTLRRERDNDAGNARGTGAGWWDADQMATQLLRSDSNADGRLERSEAGGIVQPHFDKLDVNRDGALDAGELKQLGNWLNHRHQPGTPAPGEILVAPASTGEPS